MSAWASVTRVNESYMRTTQSPSAVRAPGRGRRRTSRAAFAYQAILGAAFPIAAVPGLAVTAEYRFMGLAGNRTYGGIAASASAHVPATVSARPNYNHAFLVGLRYTFGVAPPPPPAAAAAPAPAPARSYLVFFDWDKATLTDRARQIIKEAADNSTKVQYTRIEVNGYTDTSGTPQYNQGLSIRRAQAVAGRAGQGRRAGGRDRHPGLRRDASAGADRPRRARAAEPPRRDHHPLIVAAADDDNGSGRREAPLSSCA